MNFTRRKKSSITGAIYVHELIILGQITNYLEIPYSIHLSCFASTCTLQLRITDGGSRLSYQQRFPQLAKRWRLAPLS
jgi:hypothetical protein